jgi:hypothetical protein
MVSRLRSQSSLEVFFKSVGLLVLSFELRFQQKYDLISLFHLHIKKLFHLKDLKTNEFWDSKT